MDNNNDNTGNVNWTPPGTNANIGQDLPDGTISLVLSIIGLFLSLCASCAPGGLVLSIIAFSKGKKAMRMYESDPGTYKESSYKNARAGKIMGISGIVLGALFVLVFLLYIIIMGIAGLAVIFDPNRN